MNEKAKSESDREYLDSPDPERIWLAPKCEGLAPEGRFWCEHPRDCEECEMKSVEYIRAVLALSRPCGQEWRDISSAPKEPMDGHAYGPTILLWVDGTVGVACWDYDFRKFYIEYPEGGSQPTHWMPRPAPPAEPIVAEKSEVKS